MNNLFVDLQPVPESYDVDLRALIVQVGDVVLTRLLRNDANQPSDSVRVPVTPLGFWLADNWWRVRYESRPTGRPSASWWQSHELTGIGHGYSWPRIQLWGEDNRIAVISRSDPAGAAGSVRFLQDALLFVPAKPFESTIDEVLNKSCEIASGEDKTALRALVTRLIEEREDADVATWRRLEAIAGFDPDEAPEFLMAGLSELGDRFSVADVEEITAAQPGVDAVTTIKALLGDLNTASFELNVAQLLVHRLRGSSAAEPWMQAEESAALARQLISDQHEPLRNGRLADLVGIPKQVLTGRPARSGGPRPYGVRLQEGDRTRLLLQSHWGQDRRFEVARALGDIIWSNSSAIGPLSRAATARQKFQRAFAASLLCPPAALQAYIDSDTPSDEDISAAARHFHVADRVIRSILVNKHLINRERIKAPFLNLTSESSLEELAGAA